MNEINKNQECCPKFDPIPWDGKIFDWDNKKFIKNKVATLFYLPLNFGGTMTRSVKKLEEAETKISEGIILSEHTSPWNMNIYLAVDKEIVDAENMTLNGKFLSKVYEGNFKDTGIWLKNFAGYAKNKGVTISKIYLWYTTCPKCAKKYGKNYVVIVGQIN